MALTTMDNVQSGLEICKGQLLRLRHKFQHVLEQKEPGMEREALLDTLEEEVNGLCDSVNVLLVLKKEL